MISSYSWYLTKTRKKGYFWHAEGYRPLHHGWIDGRIDDRTDGRTDRQTWLAKMYIPSPRVYKFFDCISIVFYILFHIVCVKLFASHKKHLHLSSHMLASSVLKVHQRCLITLCSFYVCFTCGPASELSLITKLIMN